MFKLNNELINKYKIRQVLENYSWDI